MGCSLSNKLSYDTFIYTLCCNTLQIFEQLIQIEDQ